MLIILTVLGILQLYLKDICPCSPFSFCRSVKNIIYSFYCEGTGKTGPTRCTTCQTGTGTRYRTGRIFVFQWLKKCDLEIASQFAWNKSGLRRRSFWYVELPKTVSGIQIRMFLDLPDLDPLVKETDLDPSLFS
jgi:hypothetical protein